MQIPPGPDEDDPSIRTLSIGAETREQCDACQMEIFNALSNQQQASINQYNGAMNGTSVCVPNDKVGLVIGKGGLTCRDIQSRLGVKLVIPQVIDEGSIPPSRTITIVGNEQGQAQAKYEIEMIYQGTPIYQPPNPIQQQLGNMSSMQGGGNLGEMDPYTLAALNPSMLGLDPYQAAALLQQQQQMMYLQQQQQAMMQMQQQQAAYSSSADHHHSSYSSSHASTAAATTTAANASKPCN